MLEASYLADMGIWADSLPYHPFLGIFSLIHVKLIMNMTLLSSALVSCTTVALLSKFEALVSHIESTYSGKECGHGLCYGGRRDTFLVFF